MEPLFRFVVPRSLNESLDEPVDPAVTDWLTECSTLLAGYMSRLGARWDDAMLDLARLMIQARRTPTEDEILTVLRRYGIGHPEDF